MPNVSTVLAIDYGDKNIGYAYSLENMPFPGGVIQHAVNQEKTAEDISVLAQKLGCDRIVVGMPKSLQDTQTQQSKKTQKFIDFLKVCSPVPVIVYDERFTSKIADHYTQAGSKTSRDALAAFSLLQSYLDSQQQ